MPKFTKIDQGKFAKLGKEYSYVIEIAEDKPIKKEQDIRLRVVDEKPVIKKIRTRYDPEIKLFGDKKASMNLTLGYDMKELKDTIKYLAGIIIGPFVITGAMLSLTLIHKIPNNTIPRWSIWILVPAFVILMGLFFKIYYNGIMKALADYLKARDLKKTLEKEGFKQK